ncbi:MAG: YceI family protein, partial [Cytophagaceae bacterium]
MKFLFLLSWLSWLALGAGPPSKIVESEIRFQIKNAGLTVDGNLSGLEASIQLDAAHPEQARITASVPVSSMQTGISLRDKHLQKPDYFDAAKYPTITLQSKSIRSAGAGKYEGTFDLTMKGSTHEVKMPFILSAAHELRGQLEVSRLDFGIGKKSFILSDKV